MTLIFDLEADGLLETFTKIHCLVVHDSETKVEHRFVGHDEIRQGVDLLLAAPVIVAHNGIKYDVPVLEKTFGVKFNQSTLRDTLTIARLIFADCYDRDCTFVRKGMKLDKDLYGRHSLKAWGQRIGMHKGEYTGGWKEFNQEMLSYCCNDVAVTNKLYRVLDNLKYSHNALVLEHRVTWIIARQERYGFAFNTEAAIDLAHTLLAEQDALKAQMVQTVGCLTHAGKEFTPKRDNKKLFYTAGCTMTKVTFEPFNPGSREQIGTALIQRGWVPQTFTAGHKDKKTGQIVKQLPEINEATLKDAPEPLGSDLRHYLLLDKRLGAILEGKNAWLKRVTPEGRIHGSVNTNGAVTGRATHSKPNISQVPTTNKPYGKECRALFTVPEGKVLVGADLSALELRCLAHFMHPYDGGAYGRSLLEGTKEDETDPHSMTAHIIGLDPKKTYVLNGVQDNGREFSKRLMYAYLYGAGGEKVGTVVGKDKWEGNGLKAKLLAGMPALARIIKNISSDIESRGYLLGLDGRKLKIRSKHAALNTLLQSAGALLSKQALVFFDEYALSVGRDHCQQVAWIHDEIQIESDPEIAEETGKAAVESFERAGRHFKFNLPITGTYTVGKTWRDTH